MSGFLDALADFLRPLRDMIGVGPAAAVFGVTVGLAVFALGLLAMLLSSRWWSR